MADEFGGIGNAMKSLPLRQMLTDMAVGVADAQAEMDKRSIAALKRAAAEQSGVDGATVLELGIVPPFFQFREATIDLSFELSVSSEESSGASLDVDFSMEN